ncbi:SigE family RNA polymerase sigma factor [Kribbella monticola]|uniref:SigE family RNA polymerase sigma factor n=1 Tax=Kribbella monticola TaxID=2185285 RepID=UPI000DD3B56E|nr:SigE family RNA polymerase sigma factor [Kribbella monticola]
MSESDAFVRLVTAHERELLRAAWLLTGNWASAEDLLQTTLTKTWQNWGKVSAADEPLAYVRRILVNTHLKLAARRWKAELPFAVLPDQPARDGTTDSDLRAGLVKALAGLPPRQRAVVVLRYLCDLTEAQTAAALGCSIGTVKAQASRAMAILRTNPALAGLLDVEVSS